jgi:hypothetical protein
MRKLTILLALATLVGASAGCTSRCRNLLHKGSPCGTLFSPPALSAPMAMSAPMAQPMCIQQAPMCVPCDPCMQYDPCGGTTVGSGYFGGYMPSGDCGCEGGATTGTIVSPGATLSPSGGYAIPGPTP